MLNSRTFAGRLVGFPQVPFDQRHTIPLKARAAFVEVLRDVAACPDARCRRAAGIAALLLGRPGIAVDQLNRVTALDPGDAAAWNDLAVAQLENAATGRPQDLIDALVAVDRAERLAPSLTTISFNRALILDRIGVRAVGGLPYAAERQRVVSIVPKSAPGSAFVRKAVADFPQLTRTSGELLYLHDWATAFRAGDSVHARQHLALARAIGETLRETRGEHLLADAVSAIAGADAARTRVLVDAHHDYYDGRTLYRERRVQEALPLLQRAAVHFREGGSPMASVAEYYTASCLYDLNRNAEAFRAIDRLLQSTPPRYPALRGQLHWQRATILSASGLLRETLDEYVRALSLLDRLGERESATLIRAAASAVYALMGRRVDSWRMRLAVLAELSRTGNAEGVQSTLELAARTEALAGDWDAAHALLRVALKPELRLNARVTASALFWMALAAHRLGLATEARALIVDATQSLNAVRDPSLHARAAADLLFAVGIVIRDSDPRRAVRVLTRFINDAATRQDLFLLPEAYVERARAWLKLRDDQAALADYDAASSAVDQRRRGGDRDDLRDAYFRTGDVALRETVNVLDRRGEPLRAYAAIRKRRGMSTVDDYRDGVVVATFLLLDDRMLIFVCGARGTRPIHVAIARASLVQTAQRFAKNIEAADASRLSRWLLDPIRVDLEGAARLVIVPDAALEGIPFAALPIASGERLIERLEIAIAPSGFRSTARNANRNRTALIIGNPALDPVLRESLPDLPAAAAEAKQIAETYGAGAIVRTGADATVGSFRNLLPRATIAHFAGHAMIVSDDLSRSFLALAPGDGDATGLLSLRDIGAMHLYSPIVVLAGCRTASPVVERAGSMSAARAFLDAGASSVVGTLWDVEDEDAANFSIEVHRHLAAGSSPAAAVRAAQIARIPSGNRSLHALRGWCAFQVYGSGD